MSVTEKTLPCTKCGKSTNLKDIRADLNAKDWICLQCYELQFKRNTKKIENSKSAIKTTKELQPQSKKLYFKVTLKCGKCKYYFTTDPGYVPKLCPSCGMSKTLAQLPSVSSILREIEQEESVKPNKWYPF